MGACVSTVQNLILTNESADEKERRIIERNYAVSFANSMQRNQSESSASTMTANSSMYAEVPGAKRDPPKDYNEIVREARDKLKEKNAMNNYYPMANNNNQGFSNAAFGGSQKQEMNNNNPQNFSNSRNNFNKTASTSKIESNAFETSSDNSSNDASAQQIDKYVDLLKNKPSESAFARDLMSSKLGKGPQKLAEIEKTASTPALMQTSTDTFPPDKDEIVWNQFVDDFLKASKFQKNETFVTLLKKRKNFYKALENTCHLELLKTVNRFKEAKYPNAMVFDGTVSPTTAGCEKNVIFVQFNEKKFSEVVPYDDVTFNVFTSKFTSFSSNGSNERPVKKEQDANAELEMGLRRLVERDRYPTLLLSSHGEIMKWNIGASRLFGIKAMEKEMGAFTQKFLRVLRKNSKFFRGVGRIRKKLNDLGRTSRNSTPTHSATSSPSATLHHGNVNPNDIAMFWLDSLEEAIKDVENGFESQVALVELISETEFLEFVVANKESWFENFPNINSLKHSSGDPGGGGGTAMITDVILRDISTSPPTKLKCNLSLESFKLKNGQQIVTARVNHQKL